MIMQTFFLPFICSLLFCFHVSAFKLGVENIPHSFVKFVKKKNYRIGLITNQTGITRAGVKTVDVLQRKGINVVALYVPEHGLDGMVSAGNVVNDSLDMQRQIPVVSLYEHGKGRQITAEKLNQIDMFIFDIQDSGMRHYTYISTLFTALQAAAEHDKQFVVLDRPNPLGSRMEGPLVEEDLVSFISIAPIPLRHGMTIGELAWYCNTYCVKKTAHLHVIPMKHYHRIGGIPGGLQQHLSPNIQTMQACFGYSFLGLLGEVKPFDIGLGSDVAFQAILLPESLHVNRLTWKKAQQLLQSHGITSSFYKRFHEGKKEIVSGLRLRLDDISTVSSFTLFIDLLQLFQKEGIKLSFSAHFDKAVGSKKVQQLFTGQVQYEDFFKIVRSDLSVFYKKVQKMFLYKPIVNYL